MTTAISQRTEIDGHTYEVRMLGTKVADDVKIALFRLLGKSFRGAQDGQGYIELFASALGNLADSVQRDDYRYIRDQMLKVSTLIRKGDIEAPVSLESVYETHFQGRNRSATAWLVFAVEVNYSDFLAELGAIVTFAREKLFRSNSPKESNGGDGAQSSNQESVSER